MVSHLDLMRSFERMLRRANLPFRMTEGFHPTPRLVFAQSLSLGVIGNNEVVELELTETTEPDDVLTRLQAQAPPGLEFRSAQRIPLKTTARPRRATYIFRTEVTDGAARGQALLAATELWVERERPRPRQINVRSYIESLIPNETGIAVRVWLTQDGTVRADELVRLLHLPAETIIERADLEILDEIPVEEAARTPKIDAQTRPWSTPYTPQPTNEPTPDEVWGATSNGPVVE